MNSRKPNGTMVHWYNGTLCALNRLTTTTRIVDSIPDKVDNVRGLLPFSIKDV